MADYGKIRQQGEQAHATGDTANPYNPGTSSFAAWQAGWKADAEAKADRAAIDDQRADERRIWNE